MDERLTSRTNDRWSSRSQRGFTLVEVLIAVFLLTVGIAATIGVIGASGHATLGAQRADVATQQEIGRAHV